MTVNKTVETSSVWRTRQGEAQGGGGAGAGSCVLGEDCGGCADGLTDPEALRCRGWRGPRLLQPPPSLGASPRPTGRTRGPSGVTTGLGSAESSAHKTCPTRAMAMQVAALLQTAGRERDVAKRPWL